MLIPDLLALAQLSPAMFIFIFCLTFRIVWTVPVTKYKSVESTFVPLGHNLTFKTIGPSEVRALTLGISSERRFAYLEDYFSSFLPGHILFSQKGLS